MNVHRTDELHAGACGFCGRNRWRTLLKSGAWKCRNCGAVRTCGEVDLV